MNPGADFLKLNRQNIGRDGGLAVVFHFQDEPRREMKSFLKHLGTKHSIKEVILLSGDRPAEVALFAAGI